MKVDDLFDDGQCIARLLCAYCPSLNAFTLYSQRADMQEGYYRPEYNIVYELKRGETRWTRDRPEGLLGAVNEDVHNPSSRGGGRQ